MNDPSISRRRKPRIKLICSFNGTFQPRPPSGKLRYTGGETRIISVDRNIRFSRLKLKISELICCPNICQYIFSLLYQLPDSEPTQEQAPLVLIASDDDVQCMLDEYEKLEFYGKHCRLWIFVCNDNGYVNLRKKDNGVSNFVETESLNSGFGVLCNNNGFDGDKHKSRLMSERLSLCENGFVNQNSLTHLCGGQFGGNKVKKRVTNGDKVKSSEDSLRKMVLKQQLLAKQSSRIRSFSGGIGLAIEHAEMDRANCDNEKHGNPLIDLSPEPETPLSCNSTNPSFLASSCRGNPLDYKFHNPNLVESKNFSNLVPLSVYCSHPLNPKNGNPRMELNNSRNGLLRQSNLSLGNTRQTSTCNFSQSIAVLPFPKPNSMGSCYFAKCELRSVEPASLSNMNRENIMPRAADSMTLRSGLTPFSCSNQLVGSVYSARSSCSSSHSGIHNHQFGLSNARNQRIFPYDFRNNRSNLNKIGNHRNPKLDGRPWVGNFYPGLMSSSSISKLGQFMRSYCPTLLKPWSDSHHLQVEGELRTSEYVLNKETWLSLPYGNQENISEQGGLGVPNDGKPNLNECHLSFYDLLPGNQSLLPLSASENSSGCIKEANTQIDLLTDPGTEQLKVTSQQDPYITNSSNKLGLECRAKLLEIGADCKSFSKHQTGAHTLEGSIASSANFSFHNLSLSSFKDVEPPTPPGISNISEALLKPQSDTFDLMDEGHFSSGPQVQSSSGAAYSEKTLKLQKDTDQGAEFQWDLESTLFIDEKEEIKKTHMWSKINGGIPTELATVYTHLATRDLQTIKNSDLEYIKELGSGTYGTVFYGKWKGSDVAVKRIKPGCFNGGAVEEDRLVTDFWKEAHILGQLHHPNIVALYGVVMDVPVTNLATVTEYMVNGSLKQILRRKDRTIDRRKRLILAMDAAFGMEYLHEKNIVHFDLKSHNFLVNMRDPQRPVCKIGDLGLSKIKQKTLVSGGVRGTIPWMAPELLNSKNMVTEKVDVYSFGIVMWELLTGEEPYANMRSHEIIAGIIKGTLRPETPSWCDPAWKSLMEKCWSSDPDARPSFTEIAKELRAMAAAMNIK